MIVKCTMTLHNFLCYLTSTSWNKSIYWLRFHQKENFIKLNPFLVFSNCSKDTTMLCALTIDEQRNVLLNWLGKRIPKLRDKFPLLGTLNLTNWEKTKQYNCLPVNYSACDSSLLSLDLCRISSQYVCVCLV